MLPDGVDEALRKVGGKRVLLCDSSWASEESPIFGVEESPDIEAVQQFARLLGRQFIEVQVGSQAYVRNLAAAAEAAVQRGQFNLAKVLAA